jgi:hypothetical protein
MKVSVDIPKHLVDWHARFAKDKYIDDILLWCMEFGIDAEFYCMKGASAVFVIADDEADLFMFHMVWGVTKHKRKELMEG